MRKREPRHIGFHPRDVASDNLAWAPVIANGAALVAMTGLIGNVPDPEFALRALRVPMGLFGLGTFLGLLSLCCASRQGLLERRESAEHLTYELARKRQKEARDTQFALPSLEVLRVINSAPGAAEDRIRSQFQDNMEYFSVVDTEAEKLIARSLQAIESLRPASDYWATACIASGLASIISGAAAFLFIVLAPSADWHIQGASAGNASPSNVLLVDQKSEVTELHSGPLSPRPSSARR